jgi:hypothetical protein
VELKLNESHQILAYDGDDVNLLVNNMVAINKNAETLIN